MSLRENAEKVKSAKNNSGRKPVVAEDVLKKLLEQGKKDAEIALALGVSRQAVAAARQRMGLRSNHGINDEELIKFHGEGKLDDQIAEILNVPRTTVVKARKRLGLKTNRKTGRPVKNPSMVITEIIQNKVMRQLAMGYAPREIAIKNGLKRKEVINIYMSCKPKTWVKMLDDLSTCKRNKFYMWYNRSEPIIRGKVKILNAEIVKAKIKIIRKRIAELPTEEKGGLPTPEVMARMGVRNAYMVDMWQDANYVGMQHMIELLKCAMERAYWQEIRSGMDMMDKDILSVIERYLYEEVYIPFFASEFNGIMPGLIEDTQKYNDTPGINIYIDDDYEPDCMIGEILELETEQSTTATAHRFGKGGGKRKRMEHLKCLQ